MTVVVIFFKSVVYARFCTFAARFFHTRIDKRHRECLLAPRRRLVKAVMRFRPDAPPTQTQREYETDNE